MRCKKTTAAISDNMSKKANKEKVKDPGMEWMKKDTRTKACPQSAGKNKKIQCSLTISTSTSSNSLLGRKKYI